MKFRGRPLTEDDREHIAEHVQKLIDEVVSMRRVVYHMAPETEVEVCLRRDVSSCLEEEEALLRKLLALVLTGQEIQAPSSTS